MNEEMFHSYSNYFEGVFINYGWDFLGSYFPFASLIVIQNVSDKKDTFLIFLNESVEALHNLGIPKIFFIKLFILAGNLIRINLEKNVWLVNNSKNKIK
jgi:hypothetical protein